MLRMLRSQKEILGVLRRFKELQGVSRRLNSVSDVEELKELEGNFMSD